MARQQEGFECESASDFALVMVQTSGPVSAGGSCLAAPAGGTIGQDQNLLELTDNLTITAGAHRITLGTHDERLRLAQLSFLDFGFSTQWKFGSLDALEAGKAESYRAVLRNPQRRRAPLRSPDPSGRGLRPGPVESDTPAHHHRRRPGRRAVPLPRSAAQPGAVRLARHRQHPDAQRPSALGAAAGGQLRRERPGRTYLRGGIGWFAGRPAYKWFVEVDTHSGLEAYSLFCDGASTPTFTLDPTKQPTNCGGEHVPQSGPINVFDPGFVFPRNLKVALGADQRLPGGAVATVDLLYTRAANQLELGDRNLQAPATVATGEDGRLLYGTIRRGRSGAEPGERSVRASDRGAECVRQSCRVGDRPAAEALRQRHRAGRLLHVQPLGGPALGGRGQHRRRAGRRAPGRQPGTAPAHRGELERAAPRHFPRHGEPSVRLPGGRVLRGTRGSAVHLHGLGRRQRRRLWRQRHHVCPSRSHARWRRRARRAG